jgi:hypothetical protein
VAGAELPFLVENAANKAVLMSFPPTKVSLRGAQSKALTLCAACSWREFRLLLVPRFAGAHQSRFDGALTQRGNSSMGSPHDVTAGTPLYACTRKFRFVDLHRICICSAPLYGFPRPRSSRFSFTAEKIGSACTKEGPTLNELCVRRKNNDQHTICEVLFVD